MQKKKYYYTIHAKEKLKEPASKKLGITRKLIEKTIENPSAKDLSEKPVIIAIGNLTETLSLCAVYRKVKKVIRIITFYPAEKGRYERKILSG